MFGIQGSYKDLWQAIIRPPRDEYQVEDLGPKEFKIQGNKVKRTDLELTNARGLKIQCSHFEPVRRPCKVLPCVVYMHGNCSSRVESLNCLDVLIPQNITLFSLDFAGSGLSEGEFISLGYFEREDVVTVTDHLRASGTVSSIGLWGRSMGAVTALMHADRDPSIAGLVLDSPFSSLRTLAEDLCKSRNVPSLVMSAAMVFVKSTIKDKAHFDLDKLNPLKNHVSQAFIPALFVYAKKDDFILPKHTQSLHQAYATDDKNIIEVDGDHNSQRSQFMKDSVGIHFYNSLQVEALVNQNPEKYTVEQMNQMDSKNSQSQKNIENFAPNNRRIGNDDLVHDALGYEAYYEDEDELEKAIQESLKIQNEQNPDSNQPQSGVKPKQKPQNSSNSQQPQGDNDQEMQSFKEESKLEDYFIDDPGYKQQVPQSNEQQAQIYQQQQQQQIQNNQQQSKPSDQQDDLIDFDD